MFKKATKTLGALLVLAIGLTAAGDAQARSRTSPLLRPAGTEPGEIADTLPRTWHPSCTREGRRPVILVVALDAYRLYRPANEFEATQARGLLETLCPRDSVSLVAVHTKARRLGETSVIKDLSDIDDLVLRIEERWEPKGFRRINDLVLKTAVAEWGQRENLLRPDALRVLVFFTRHVESKAPRSSDRPDFSWANPPYWLAGHALTAIFRPITSDEEVVAWEIFVPTVPSFVEKEVVPQGLRVDLSTWLDTVRLAPRPAPPGSTVEAGATPATAAPIVLPAAISVPDTTKLWKPPEETILWRADWTPWAVVAGLVLVVLALFLWILTRSGSGRGELLVVAAPELTLVIRDRLHDRVVGQEKVVLDGPIRIGASLSSDVTIPGPYALEILPGLHGASPRLRAINSLPVEIKRAAGGRLLRATESVPIPLRPGDHIHLGAGQEVEVQFG